MSREIFVLLFGLPSLLTYTQSFPNTVVDLRLAMSFPRFAALLVSVISFTSHKRITFNAGSKS